MGHLGPQRGCHLRFLPLYDLGGRLPMLIRAGSESCGRTAVWNLRSLDVLAPAGGRRGSETPKLTCCETPQVVAVGPGLAAPPAHSLTASLSKGGADRSDIQVDHFDPGRPDQMWET